VIQVQKLVKTRGNNRVLDGISLRVSAGQSAVFIGPSGSGKSTLLRCINALESFEEGEIQVGEVKNAGVKTLPAQLVQLRRQIGMVFQQFNLFPHLTALENVACGPRFVLGESKEKAHAAAKELLHSVGLGDRFNHKPDELSGGQQQRVAIARALAVKPKAILFDEPTSALDPRSADEVQTVIAKLAEAGMTLLIVTHSMSFARKVADRAYFMNAGKIVEEGPPKHLFDAPRTPIAQEFIERAKHD
jgi:ABC-type polar amino acid transport system ATPase subunit